MDSGLAGCVSIEAASRGLFNLLAQNEQRGHCLEACAGRLVFSGVANPPDHLFATELLQVVSCLSRLVVRFAANPEPGQPTGKQGILPARRTGPGPLESPGACVLG